MENSGRIRKEPWPGQVDVIYYDLAQVTALASVVRSEVFFTLSHAEPMSTADVAKAIGKAPTAVRYHINELLRVGLIIAVEQRKRRSRIEDAYVHKGLESYSQRGQVSEEYLRQINRGFNAILRHMGKERAAALRVRNLDEDPTIPAGYRRQTVRVSLETARETVRQMNAIVDNTRNLEDPEGKRYHVAWYLSLSLGDALEIYEQRTGHPYRHESSEPEA